MAQRIPYPPCLERTCGGTCCNLGYRSVWKDLLGTKGDRAKEVIEHDNPLVTVVFISPGRVGFPDYCCNRVYVILDDSGNVTHIPVVG